MKTITTELSRMTIQEFAEQHDLVMDLREIGCAARLVRNGPVAATVWHASFKHAEVSEGGTLISVYGAGHTKEAAIHDYARQLSHEHLVIDAMSKTDRREIRCPIFTNGD